MCQNSKFYRTQNVTKLKNSKFDNPKNQYDKTQKLFFYKTLKIFLDIVQISFNLKTSNFNFNFKKSQQHSPGQDKFQFNSLPLFLLQGCQFQEPFISQCLCIIGLIVKIWNFMFYIFLTFGQFHQKKKYGYCLRAKLFSLCRVYLFNFTLIL